MLENFKERINRDFDRHVLVRAFVVSLLILFLVSIASLAIGPVQVSIPKMLQNIFGSSHALTDFEKTIVWQIRLPRVLLGIIVGAALAISGGVFQTVFHNSLADPYLLGAASGAGLGATIALVAGGANFAYLPLFAFLGSLLAVVATLLIAGKFYFDPSTLLLSGIAIGSFFTAIQTYLQQRHSTTLRPVYSWILGELGNATWSQVRWAWGYIAIAIATLILISKKMDALLLSDDEAHSLGINVKRIRLIAILAASFATATAVAASGLIGFVGLVIPHMVKMLYQNISNKFLIIYGILGGAFLTLTDLIARVIISPAQLPIGVITAFIGAPFFLYLLKQRRFNK